MGNSGAIPHMAPVRAVVWDWNGTLLDDTEACVRTLNTMLARRGRPRVSVAQYRDIFRFPVRDYYLDLGFDFAAENWDAVAVEFHALYEHHALAAPLRRGIADVVHALRRRGVPMAVLSASNTPALRAMIGRHGLADAFDHIAGLSDLYAASKVERGRRLFREWDVDPAATLLIGDTTHDREVAERLGCHALLLAGGHQAAWRLRSGGSPVESVRELLRVLLARLPAE